MVADWLCLKSAGDPNSCSLGWVIFKTVYSFSFFCLVCRFVWFPFLPLETVGIVRDGGGVWACRGGGEGRSAAAVSRFGNSGSVCEYVC